MINLYKQEFFKLKNKSSTYFIIFFLFVQNLSFAVISHLYPKHFIPRELFASNYVSTAFVSLILLGFAASEISSEFELKTIKYLVCESHSRQSILISKWLITLTYSAILYFLMMFLSLINKYLFFHNAFKLTDRLKDGTGELWNYWLQSSASNFLNLWLLLSVVFLISAVFKKSSSAIIVGVTSYFALSAIGTIMFQLIDKIRILKWNPINFLNLPQQIASPNVVVKLTHLTTLQLVLGNFVYIVIFLGLGLFFFSKKEF